MKPIKTIEREATGYREVERTWTYQELFELFDPREICAQLACRCQAFELAVAEWHPSHPHIADGIIRRVEELEQRMVAERERRLRFGDDDRD